MTISPFRRVLRYGSINLTYGLVVHGAVALYAGLLYRAIGSEFGVFALVTGSASAFWLLEDSLGALVVRAVSRQDSTTRSELKILKRWTIVGSLCCAMLLFGGLISIYGERYDGLAIATIGGMTLLFSAAASFQIRLLEGHEKFLLLRSVQSIALLLRVGSGLAALAMGVNDLLPFLLIHLVASATLALGLGFASLHLKLPSLAEKVGNLNELARKLRQELRPLAVAKASSALSYRADLWLVQVLVGEAGTALYALANTVFRSAVKGLEILKGAVLPVSVSSWNEKLASEQRSFVINCGRASFLLVGGACAAGFASAEPLLKIWFGEDSASTLLATKLLLLFVATTSLRSTVQSILIGQGRFQVLESAFVRAALFNLAISTLATWKLGLWGPAFGTACAGVYLLFENSRRSERALGLHISTMMSTLILPGLLVFGSSATLPAALPRLDNPASDLLLRSLFSLSVFCLASWILLFSSEERKAIRSGSYKTKPGKALDRQGINP